SVFVRLGAQKQAVTQAVVEQEGSMSVAEQVRVVVEAMTPFEASLHPRDRGGKFALSGHLGNDAAALKDRLGRTRTGSSVPLSNDATVRKTGKDTYQVSHPCD